MPTRSLPVGLLLAKLSASVASARSARISLQRAWNAAPSSVRRSDRVERNNSRAPSWVSSRVTARLTPDGVMPNWLAAAAKLLASTTRTKVEMAEKSSIVSIPRRFVTAAHECSAQETDFLYWKVHLFSRPFAGFPLPGQQGVGSAR